MGASRGCSDSEKPGLLILGKVWGQGRDGSGLGGVKGRAQRPGCEGPRRRIIKCTAAWGSYMRNETKAY